MWVNSGRGGVAGSPARRGAVGDTWQFSLTNQLGGRRVRGIGLTRSDVFSATSHEKRVRRTIKKGGVVRNFWVMCIIPLEPLC